ncbi:hypothetical protein Afer_1195 [Acidimicrobium ferrooxidans DSM 10331]|uniref:Alpha/beta hydrolase n=1 Tax=Acidimicrobium ferrooxidans (strain DSM 10331 / JCM 15462 / NBRC 103882 / ICP) TaxID=525909 RepID=C7LZG9_ACIFD|nr:hypothetical protein Afer_1195 [Acidimicrobium ferrooxidans DSM 10331]
MTVTEPGRVTCVPTTHACSERSYLLDVFYPSRTASSTIVADAPVASVGGPYPLIVFAAGFDEDPSAYVPLIEAWVRAGYVVAAPRFPLSSAWALATYGVDLHDAAIADAFESDMLNEPGDLSAAIGEMDVLARSGVLAGRVATDDVALAGQSDGGDVVLASADNTCCAIPGVRAVAVLSGAVFSPFGGSFFGSSVPMLVVQGSADTVNPPSASQAIYADAQAPKYLEWLLGADHLGPYTTEGPAEQAVAAVSIAFFDTYLRQMAPSVTQVATIGQVSGVATEEADVDGS